MLACDSRNVGQVSLAERLSGLQYGWGITGVKFVPIFHSRGRFERRTSKTPFGSSRATGMKHEAASRNVLARLVGSSSIMSWHHFEAAEISSSLHIICICGI